MNKFNDQSKVMINVKDWDPMSRHTPVKWRKDKIKNKLKPTLLKYSIIKIKQKAHLLDYTPGGGKKLGLKPNYLVKSLA